MDPDQGLALLIGGAALAFGIVQLSRLAGPARRRSARLRVNIAEARAELGRGILLGEVSVSEAGTCPLCLHGVLRSTARVCPACATPCHADCWSWNGGCAVYACAARRIPADR